ncbi:MAG: hypothetical protein SNG14_06115 [Rikenellaceae bacterium]
MSYKVWVYIVAIFIAVGCMKEEAYRSDIVFRPYAQQYDGAEYENLAGVVGYAFAADTAEVSVLSYDDALNGRVVSRETGAVVAPIATTAPYVTDESGFTTAVSMRVDREWVMLLAVDTQNEDYTYTYYQVGLNLAETFFTLSFRSWYEGEITVGKWYYIYPEGNGLVEPEPDIPTVD